MMKKQNVMPTLVLWVCLVGCGEADPISRRAFVLDAIHLPKNGGQFRADVDGDGRAENKLADLLAVLGPLVPTDNDPQRMMDRLLSRGQYLVGLEVESGGALDPGDARIRVLLLRDRDEVATDNFSGSESFSPGKLSPPGPGFGGTLYGESLTAGPAKLPFIVPLGVAYPIVMIDKVRILGKIGSGGISGGVISGAIPLSRGADNLLFGLAVSLDPLLKSPTTDPSLRAFLRLLDSDGNGTLNAPDLEHSGLVQMMLTPDVDLDGDGQADALSAGIGFSAVPCTIVH